MDSFRPSRYTVLNSDTDNIYISKSLLNKLSQEQQQQQKPQQSASKSPPEPSSVPPSAAKKPAQPEFNTDSFQGSSGGAYATFGQSSSAFDDMASMPASIDPEFIAKHAQFDSSANLYALRGEYERKLQQYQQVWRHRFSELEGLNEQLFKLNSEKFAKDVSRVDERFFRSHATYEVPCKSPESTVTQCLSANPKKPLLCANEIKQFSSCVDKTRIDILKR